MKTKTDMEILHELVFRPVLGIEKQAQPAPVGTWPEAGEHTALRYKEKFEAKFTLAGGMQQDEIAQRFGVRNSSITKIKHGTSWQHSTSHAEKLARAVEHVLIASEDGGNMNDIDWDMLRAALAAYEEGK